MNITDAFLLHETDSRKCITLMLAFGHLYPHMRTEMVKYNVTVSSIQV